MSGKGAPGTRVVSWGDESSEPRRKWNQWTRNSNSLSSALPAPPLCPKQAAPVPLAPAGLTGGQAVSTSGYHPSHILLPQHPFPNGNEAVWWNQEGKSTTFNNTPPVSSNTPKAPALRHATALCGFLCLPGFVETRGQSAGPTGAKVKWGTSSVPRKTSAAREILFHQITCLTAGNTACGRVQGPPPSPACCLLSVGW